MTTSKLPELGRPLYGRPDIAMSQPVQTGRIAPFALKLVGLIMLAGSLMSGTPAYATTRTVPADAVVGIAIDKRASALTAGNWMAFETVLRNQRPTATPPLVAHLSIAALQPGQYVDPEDWSPERSQYLPPLQPGESVKLDWQLHALFEGAFIVFVTVVAADLPSTPVTSATLRVRVAPDDVLPMDEVVPVVAVVPAFPLALLVVTVAYRRWRNTR